MSRIGLPLAVNSQSVPSLYSLPSPIAQGVKGVVLSASQLFRSVECFDRIYPAPVMEPSGVVQSKRKRYVEQVAKLENFVGAVARARCLHESCDDDDEERGKEGATDKANSEGRGKRKSLLGVCIGLLIVSGGGVCA